MAVAVERQPWLAYAAGSDGPDFAQFCRAHVIQSVDEFAGHPLDLEPWQADMIGEALAFDAEGRPIWRTALLVVPRKNGKTALLAAYALWRLLTDDGQPEIILAASSDEQASRLFDAIVSYLRRNDALRDMVVVRDYAGEILRADGGGLITRVSSDPKRLHGYNPSIVICDELAQWVTPTLRAAWAALTTGGGARKRAQVFAITTPGEVHTREDGILGRMLDRAGETGDTERTRGRDVIRSTETRTLAFVYSAPWPEANPQPLRDAHAAFQKARRAGLKGHALDGPHEAYRAATARVLASWRAANPASWITDDFLVRQALAPELSVAEVLQLHAGVWAAGEHAWITRDAWLAAEAYGASLQPGDAIALGFDGSRRSDATALVACRMGDGLVVPLTVWEAPIGMAGANWEVPRGEVDAAVAAAFRSYTVARFYADPPYWQSEVDAWAQAYSDKVVVSWETHRERQMAAALERLETDFAAGLVQHDGSEVLLRHVTNAVRMTTRNGYGIRKPAKNSDRKIDAAVAMVLAYEARCDAVAAGWRVRSRVPVSF
jgi:phage terminase large subunit-like protein